MNNKFLGLVIFFGLCSCTTALGANLGIWPINPRINANESATAIWVKNNDQKTLLLQVRVMNWQQEDGRDEIAGQQALIASPPMVKIAPGQQQMIRIVNRQGPVPETAQENSYRIFVDEIPDTRHDDAISATLKFQMRYSLPLFSGVADKGKKITDFLKKNEALLTFRITGETQKYIEVKNTGIFHIRLSHVKVINASGKEMLLSDGLLGYVLPDRMMRWPLTNDQASFIGTADTLLKFRQDHTEISIAQASP